MTLRHSILIIIIIIIIIIIFNQEAPLTNGGFQGGPGLIIINNYAFYPACFVQVCSIWE